MNIYEEIRDTLINILFGPNGYYESLLESGLLQNKLITFLTDVIPYLMLLTIIFGIFYIPFHFIFKLFNRIVREVNTNAVSQEKESTTRKTRK